jgi:RNA methyltransferase, TrmH family
MVISQLTSRNNPLLKTIRLVLSSSHRAPKGLVVAEGIRVLEEVLKHSCKISAVIVSESYGNSAREEELLRSLISQEVRICRTDSNLFSSVSDVETPQGIIALVSVPEVTLNASLPGNKTLILFALGIQDPGNLGTLIRASAAAGVSLICTSKGTVSARNPKAIRASAGAFFRLPVIEHVEISEFLRYCALHQIRLYRTDVREGLPHTEADLRSRCAIMLGNEGSGIAMQKFEDIQAVHIPMAEGIESLNVAVAGAILLFEASRQRMHPS